MVTERNAIALVPQRTIATDVTQSESRAWLGTLFGGADQTIRLQIKWIAQLILKTIGWTCWCTTTTWVFKDVEGHYIRCLDCGQRLPYEWLSDSTPQEKRM